VHNVTRTQEPPPSSEQTWRDRARQNAEVSRKGGGDIGGAKQGGGNGGRGEVRNSALVSRYRLPLDATFATDEVPVTAPSLEDEFQYLRHTVTPRSDDQVHGNTPSNVPRAGGRGSSVWACGCEGLQGRLYVRRKNIRMRVHEDLPGQLYRSMPQANAIHLNSMC